MKNDICVICGNRFNKPRAGKLYCSDECELVAFDMEVRKIRRPEIDIKKKL